MPSPKSPHSEARDRARAEKARRIDKMRSNGVSHADIAEYFDMSTEQLSAFIVRNCSKPEAAHA